MVTLAGAAVQVRGHGWWSVVAVAVCVLLGLAANVGLVEDVQARRLNAMGAIIVGVIVAIILVALG